ncbi:MAG: hypothetical protein JJ891_16805 [Rhizobiaceae bacterium]|nr:hypothetical protein [Rhizobiaceae bacterium]
MMDTKPLLPPKTTLSVDDLLSRSNAAGPDLDQASNIMSLADPGKASSVSPTVAKYLYGLSQSEQGRAVLEFLCDITVRRLETGALASIEAEALAMARVKERNSIFMMIAGAVNEGQRLALSEKQTGK